MIGQIRRFMMMRRLSVAACLLAIALAAGGCGGVSIGGVGGIGGPGGGGGGIQLPNSPSGGGGGPGGIQLPNNPSAGNGGPGGGMTGGMSVDIPITLSEAQVHASLSNALATALATSGIAINNANTDLRDGQIVITFDARYNDINGRGEIYASLGVRDGALTASVTRITVNGNNVDANTLSRINQQITAAVQQLTAQGGDGSSFTVKSVRIANNNVEIVITVRS